jgi:CheY-like chemotaxis protein
MTNQPGRVMVADDEPHVRQFLLELLTAPVKTPSPRPSPFIQKTAVYRAETPSTGSEALRRARMATS